MLEITINEKNENQRLDKYLLKYLNKAPKSFVYKMLRKKNIKLNGKKAMGNEILLNHDVISFYLSEDTINSFKEYKQIFQTEQNFKIVFEDENIILCNKPTGLVSQPDINNKTSSLNDQLLFYMYEKGEYVKNDDFSPSICNRLDRNTSGIITFGKNLKTLQALNKAFRENSIDKFYLTVVEGKVDKKGIIKLYHKKENNKAILSEKYINNSKEIITEYQPILTKQNKTLLNVKLITGKSHQIRASFQHIGHSIIGDTKYNSNRKNKFGLEGQFLHCYKIHFKSKDNALEYLYSKKFTCSPEDKSFKNVLKFFEYEIKE